MQLITPSLDHHFSSCSSQCFNITVFIKYEKEFCHYAQLVLSINKKLILAQNMVHPFPLFFFVQEFFQPGKRTISSSEVRFSPCHSMVLVQCGNLS